MLKSPISVLQELAQSKIITLGEYSVIDSSGQDHCKTFTYQVIVNGEPYRGSGSTKQSAKTTCAQTAVDAVKDTKNISDLQVQAISILPSVVRTAPKNAICQINYIGQLNEFQQTHKYPLAKYADDLPMGLTFCMKCMFAGLEARGIGNTKKEAKQDAARQMLELVRENNLGLCANPLNPNNNNELIVKNIPDDYIIQRYKELSISLKEKKPGAHGDAEQYERMDKEVEIKSWDDLERELENLSYQYTQPETLQTRPYVILMTVNRGTMMGFGETRQEAMNQLVQNVYKMLQNGYKFTERFVPQENSK